MTSHLLIALVIAMRGLGLETRKAFVPTDKHVADDVRDKTAAQCAAKEIVIPLNLDARPKQSARSVWGEQHMTWQKMRY